MISTMSANPEILQKPVAPAEAYFGGEVLPVHREPRGWDRNGFAAEQIRSLVRRIFFSQETAVKHVVFSATGPEPDALGICMRVAHSLSSETTADVALVTRAANCRFKPQSSRLRNSSIKERSIRLAANLWQVSPAEPDDENAGVGRFWAWYLAQLRREFEFGIVHGPIAGASSEAGFLADVADGLVLVLAANHTRKASAKNLKQILETGTTRILGAVLADRTFPIPERIYRRL